MESVTRAGIRSGYFCFVWFRFCIEGLVTIAARKREWQSCSLSRTRARLKLAVASFNLRWHSSSIRTSVIARLSLERTNSSWASSVSRRAFSVASCSSFCLWIHQRICSLCTFSRSRRLRSSPSNLHSRYNILSRVSLTLSLSSRCNFTLIIVAPGWASYRLNYYYPHRELLDERHANVARARDRRYQEDLRKSYTIQSRIFEIAGEASFPRKLRYSNLIKKALITKIDWAVGCMRKKNNTFLAARRRARISIFLEKSPEINPLPRLLCPHRIAPLALLTLLIGAIYTLLSGRRSQARVIVIQPSW